MKDKTVPKRRALIIGISDYLELEPLEFCKNDGKEVAEVLSSQDYEIVDALLGQVSWQKMRDSIYDFFYNGMTAPEDTLLFYYSGHGIPDSDEDVYLATSEIDPDHPSKRGFNFKELTKIMRESISTRVVSILDCCYSGSAKISKGHEDDAAKLGKSTIERQSELAGEGICILAATQARQEAYALEGQNHSVFTYYILEGLKGEAKDAVDEFGYVTTDSLARYVYNTIMSLPAQKRPKQKPVRKLEASGDIVLAYYPLLARRTKIDNRTDLLQTSLSRNEEEYLKIKSSLQNIAISREGICDLVRSLGYPTVESKKQLLDPDKLFQRKDLRENILGVHKIFSQFANWIHPSTNQPFHREATIILIEVKNEEILRSRKPFELTRYVIKFGFPASQAIFFFIAQNTRWLVITAHSGSPEPEVRRLIIDLQNITRTDLQNMILLQYSKIESDEIIEHFENALPYLGFGKAFFQEYRSLFENFVRKLSPVLEGDDRYSYTQRFLGKLVFLYFLQKKGWLNGDRAYLEHRLKGLENNQAFTSLYELFSLLNTELRDKESIDNIPYLNGSLFENEPYSASQLEKIFEVCGPILRQAITIFDKYNFTVSESSAFNKEVAVDPELLGSLFESMLPETERGDKGTFYTHQNEMLFMARESIGSYLNTRLANLIDHDQILQIVYDHQFPQNITPSIARQIEQALKLIKILDPAVGSGGFLIAVLQVLLEARKKINGIIGVIEPDYDIKLKIIENNLFGIDIEHEAIELARLRLWLTLVVDEPLENVRPLPNLEYNLHRGDSLVLLESDKIHQEKLTMDSTIKNALIGHISKTREEYLHSHGKDKQTKKEELEGSLRTLFELETDIVSPEIIPFSFKYFFADVMSQGGFDVVIMNPPYITQEEIGRLQQQEGNYKEKIIKDIQFLTDNKFIPNRRSDISVYFLVRSLTLLRPLGVAVVITTNKWLDVGYGVALQEYLLTNTYLDSIYDSVDRSFSADVNTAITIIRKPVTPELVTKNVKKNLTRFVYFNIPFGQIDGSIINDLWSTCQSGVKRNDRFRITARLQSELYSDGTTTDTDNPVGYESFTSSLGKSVESYPSLDDKMYVGTKWGNIHLHAPSFYDSILLKGKNKLKPLQDVGIKIIRGPVTGNNDYFILQEISTEANLVKCKNKLGKEFYLEGEYCPKILLKPRNLSYEINSKKLKLRIFRCRKRRSELQKTYALQYIEWAETSTDAIVKVRQGSEKGKEKRITEVRTVQNRPLWYQISDVMPASVLAPQAIKNQQSVFFSKKPLFFEHRFYGIYTKVDEAVDLWLYLNSSVFRLFLELNGRTEGAGVLDVMIYEYKQCPVLYPLPGLSKKFRLLKKFGKRSPYRIINIAEQGPLEFEEEDRKQLDNLVLREIGFAEKKERMEIQAKIYSWLNERVKERLLKPTTAPDSLSANIGKRTIECDIGDS